MVLCRAGVLGPPFPLFEGHMVQIICEKFIPFAVHLNILFCLSLSLMQIVSSVWCDCSGSVTKAEHGNRYCPPSFFVRFCLKKDGALCSWSFLLVVLACWCFLLVVCVFLIFCSRSFGGALVVFL